MKLQLVAAIFCVMTLSLVSCYSYDQSGNMPGGTEVGTAAGPGDTSHTLSSAEGDAMGRRFDQKGEDTRLIYTHADTNTTNLPY
jgi:hypothetical protein